MKNIQTIAVCVFGLFPLLWSCQPPSDFCQSVKKFEGTQKGKRPSSFYFYPSTIQMLNLEKDSSFNTMVKDIQKIKILSWNNEKDTIPPDKVLSLVHDIRKDSFVDLMQLKQNNQQIMIFLRKENNKPKEFLGIIYGGSNLMIIDLLGNVPMSALQGLLNGNMKLTGFNSVLNSFTTKNTNRKKKNGEHPRN